MFPRGLDEWHFSYSHYFMFFEKDKLLLYGISGLKGSGSLGLDGMTGEVILFHKKA